MPGCGRSIGPYECCTIVTGDARELAPAIPDESIDLIFTDPVYDRIEDYWWLAATAVRLLQSKGSLLTFCGIGYLPDTLDALRVGGLNYRWQIVPHFVRRYKHIGLLKNSYQSLLWFDKGAAIIRRPWMDCQISGSESQTRYRVNGVNWAKHPKPVQRAIEALTNPGDLLLDLFCGEGLMPAMGKMWGIHYIAFEIDPDVAERARERVRNTQPPLFVLEPEQLEFG